MGTQEVRERLAAVDDLDFDPWSVAIDDADAFERLQPALQEWWVEQFGEFVPENGGLFTPPQEGAVPLIDDRENALIAAPTGSGKCVKPDTPLIVRDGDGDARVLRAADLASSAGDRVLQVDRDGTLHESEAEAYALDADSGTVDTAPSRVYRESYDGPMHRIETVYGREVEVTPAHPLLVETEDGTEWRRAERIEPGDRVGVPRELDLPEREVSLDVSSAVDALRERYDVVLTQEDAEAVRAAIESGEWDQLSESTLRRGLALADLSMEAVADRTGVGLTTVYRQVTGEADHAADRTLALLRERIDERRLSENELLVQTNNGRRRQFRYPETVDESLARLVSFVLAEGLLAEYDRHVALSISQSKRTELLEDVIATTEERFGVSFEQKNAVDWTVSNGPFAVFFSELFDLKRGNSRAVPFPDWVLNATRDVKRAFVSTFLSLEAEVREDEVRLVQGNETKIEQLNYLLLSFGIPTARGSKTRRATNTDRPTDREYYTLAVRRKPVLRRLLSEFDLRHRKADALRSHAAGETSGARVGKHRFDYESIRELSQYYESDVAFNDALGDVYEVVRRSGYATDRALRKLRSVLVDLPDEQPVTRLRRRVERNLERNVLWLEVTANETSHYEGEIVDLHVPGPHNFVGGRGSMYLHNTLASFTAIIDELYARQRRDDGLENSVYCLYVSPLKSLANDIHRNLERPLDGIHEKLTERAPDVDRVRHAIRHGDTDDAERQRMLEETPHILNTTPETLAILLNSPKFREKLRTVEYVVVDEIHSLAESKRGTHLSVSLERLEEMAHDSPTRIGCSATIEPIDEVANFLVGLQRPGGDPRPCEVVDARFAREFDLQLSCPTDDLIDTPPGEVNDRFYRELHDLIEDHTNTLVFTNTRSGAERVLHNLRERYGYDEAESGAHHGSLSKDARERVERRLKSGDLKVVTSSTSLELGIDMPHVDLVVQVGSPKSVAALLQRVGRAGHRVGQTVTGRVIALDRDELVECTVMLGRAAEGFVDRVQMPERAQDVAAQHVYGMAINEVRPESEVRAVLERAYPYREYTDAEYESLLRYLTADYDGMEDRDVYAKVWRDDNDPPDGEYHYEEFDVGESLVGKRGRLARMIYMTNVGTIPDSFTCDVFTRADDEWVGDLDEDYLDTLEPGDVFVLGGDNFEYRYRRGTKVYVDRTGARPTVPSWFSERLPLSFDLGREIAGFQGELLGRLRSGDREAVADWLRTFPVDEDAASAVARLFDQQYRYAGEAGISTDRRIVVEEARDRESYERHYYVHSTYGRRFNDGLSRALAYRCAQEATANVSVAVADNGFTLSMPLNRKVDVADILRRFDPADVRDVLRSALDGTDLLQRYFRINATRSLMILKRYKGHEKSAGQQQVSSEMLLSFAEDLEEFAVIEETYREILEDKLDLAGLQTVLGRIQAGDVAVTHHRVESPSPRAFGLATLMASDVVLAEDESAALQAFHERVLEEIDDPDAESAESGDAGAGTSGGVTGDG